MVLPATAARLVDIRPQTPRPLSIKRTVTPSACSALAQAIPDIPAPITTTLLMSTLCLGE